MRRARALAMGVLMAAWSALALSQVVMSPVPQNQIGRAHV